MITYYLKKIYSNYGFIFIVLGMLHFEVRVSLCVVAWVGTITEKTVKEIFPYNRNGYINAYGHLCIQIYLYFYKIKLS